MHLLGFLILFPVVVAALLLVFRNNTARKGIVCIGAGVIAIASIVFAATNIGTDLVLFEFSSETLNYVAFGIEIVVGLIVVAYGIKYKNVLALVLAVIQLALTVAFEFAYDHGAEVVNGLYFDSLSVLMAAIIGVVGSGICVYALGYMDDFQAHEPEGAKDRRPTFFAIMFLFLAAMFVIVFANNMTWMIAGWEVTTVSSFLLIGYTKTDEAIRNSFRQIIMNLLGGIAFLVALFLIVPATGELDFTTFIAYGVADPYAVFLPVVLLAFAGITKAAQMPFQTWLLGAMVAPTPTSALLHSSTMVKAGVFMLVKLAPVFFVSPIAGSMVTLVGGITFMLCSFMAISQSNAKRVLAYSTIANLGLITACAGVGTPEAVWAAMFLILFHAVAKSLLFLCVGTAEHHIGSRDIESMDLLFERMPKLARLMMLGIMGMFVAPFGMLIGKWQVLASFADAHQISLIVVLAFGSAATFMFWAKWFGKLSGIAAKPENVELTVHKSEWVALAIMAVLVCLGCVLMPLLSTYVVEPYLSLGLLGAAYEFLGLSFTGLGSNNLIICAIISAVVIIVLLVGLGRGKAKKVDVYLSGVTVNNEGRTYIDSLSQEREASAHNYYLKEYFGENKVTSVGTVFTIAIEAATIVVGVLMIVGLF